MGRLARGDRVAATICVVDDNAAVRHALSNLLEASGYAPVGFDSGAALLSWPHLAAIHLAVFDLQLRDMGGFVLQERFTALQPGTPWLFTSDRSHRAMARRAVQAGALALLCKPFDPGLLLHHVRQGLALRRGARG